MAVEHGHSSASFEHGTPQPIVDAAWEVLGNVDLDPASSAVFNDVVLADRFFDITHNGLLREWHGRVFLNPPGGLLDAELRSVFVKTKQRAGCAVSGQCGLPPGHKHIGVESSAKVWWQHLATEYLARRVPAAIFVGFSLEILQTTQGREDLSPLDGLVCIPAQRVRYLSADADGKLRPGVAPPHSSFIAYLGDAPRKFARIFSKFGRVVEGTRLRE